MTVPLTSPMATWSPARKGSRYTVRTPAKRFPSTAWAAMPTATETMPRPPRMLENRTLGKATVRPTATATARRTQPPRVENTPA